MLAEEPTHSNEELPCGLLSLTFSRSICSFAFALYAFFAVMETKAKQKHGGAGAVGAGTITIRGVPMDPTTHIFVDLQVHQKDLTFICPLVQIFVPPRILCSFM